MTTLTISLLRYRHSFVWLSLEAISGMEVLFYFSFKMWWASYFLQLSCLCLLSIQAREKKRIRRRKSSAYCGTAWFIFYWKLHYIIRKNLHIFVRSAWMTAYKALRSSKTTRGKLFHHSTFYHPFKDTNIFTLFLSNLVYCILLHMW